MKFAMHLTVFAALLKVGTAQAVIYGSDDRQDIYQTPWLAATAASVAVAVPKLFIAGNPDGTYSMTDVDNLAQSSGSMVCANERFTAQPSMGVCTGFLVGDRYLVTAGHCLLPNGIVDNEVHPFCEAFSWYFDYNLKKPNEFPGQKIPAGKMYGCKRVIRAENFQIPGLGISGNDFALVELDRPVEGNLKPLPVDRSPPRVGEWVYTIGHPTGLPAKYSGLSQILNLDRPNYFSVNLDTLGGNSGGPVLNVNNQVTGILVSGHQNDYYRDPAGCMRPNRCDLNGENCIAPSQLQRSNFVQNIDSVMRYLPRLNFVQN